MKKTELQTMVVRELKALARKMKILLPSDARKADIVDALASAFRLNSKKTESAATAPAPARTPRTGRTVTKTAAKKKTAGKKQDLPDQKPAAKPVAAAAAGREWKLPPGAEEPLLAQERVSDAKYYPRSEKEMADSSYRELPAHYGEEKISFMVRDPYLAYVYWEVTPGRLQREKAWFGWKCKLTVRIYDVTGVQFDGRNAVGYFDQEVAEPVGRWYFDLGRPSHTFVADVGLLSPEGRFQTLARSNQVLMPRDGVSDIIDEQWMLLDEEFWKLYGFPAGASSAQIQEMIRARRTEQQITSFGTVVRIGTKRK